VQTLELPSASIPSGAVQLGTSHFGAVLKLSSTTSPSSPGTSDWSTIASVVERSGVTTVRTPGGTEAWNTFNFLDRNHVRQLQQIIDFCAEHQLSLQFTVNLRQFFVETSTTVDGTLSMSAAQRRALESFVRTDLLEYAHSRNVRVQEIQLDNEPLHRDQNSHFLNFREYGLLANTYAKIIGPIVREHNRSTGQETEILVVTAASEGATSSTGEPAFHGAWGIRPIVGALTEGGGAGYVTGVDLHYSDVTLHPEYEDVLGAEDNSSPFYGASLYDSLKWQQRIWGDSTADRAIWSNSLKYHVSAWSYPQRDDGGGSLSNAALGFLHMHAYSMAGIAAATNYVLVGSDANGLFSNSGRERAGGAMFAMMAQELPGFTAVKYHSGPSPVQALQENYVHATFASDSAILLFVANRTPDVITLDVKFARLIESLDERRAGVSDISATVIGVNSNRSALDPNAPAEVDRIGELLDVGQEHSVAITLSGYEIASVSFALNILGTSDSDFFVVDNRTRTIDGGEGLDTVSFSRSPESMRYFQAEAVVEFSSSHAKLGSIEVVHGTPHDDRFVVQVGGVQVHGDAGNDTFEFRGASRSSAFGGEGDDTFIILSEGSLAIHGEGGDDRFFVLSGRARIEPGPGNDTVFLDGSAGTILTFGPDSGRDTIHGYSRNVDRIEFHGVQRSALEVSIIGDSTLVRLSEESEIFLDGVSFLNLSTDVLFV